MLAKQADGQSVEKTCTVKNNFTVSKVYRKIKTLRLVLTIPQGATNPPQEHEFSRFLTIMIAISMDMGLVNGLEGYSHIVSRAAEGVAGGSFGLHQKYARESFDSLV